MIKANARMSAQEMMRLLQIDPCTSYWLKDAINAIARRDCVDALRDAETLVAVCKAYCRDVEYMNSQV
jgi:hypothetical protein